MRNWIYVVLLAPAVWSCEKTVLLDLKQAPPKVVIEAQVTDRPGRQFVKITRTAGFYDSGETPRITDALVEVEDDLGTVFPFVHNPNDHPDSAGIYLPAAPFTGVIGRTYYLTVVADGQTFEAQDKLLNVIPIDSIKYRVNPEEAKDPKDKGKIYELLIFAREPQEEINFYLFKFYRNDSLVYYNDSDIYGSDDELLGEKIDGVPSPVFYKLGDWAKVEFYSLSRQGYVFYNDLWGLLNNDAGGMFGPIPASPRTNLTNGALGFFQVSALKDFEILLE